MPKPSEAKRQRDEQAGRRQQAGTRQAQKDIAQPSIFVMPINYSKYPPDWRKVIVPRIKERDGHKCKFCGIPNYTIKPNGTKVILTVAHLDHDSKNHDVQDERLAALCQACHLKYDLSRHIMKRRYGRDVFNQPTLF